MGLPSIRIAFIEAAKTAYIRSIRGQVGLVLKDTVPATNPVIMNDTDDIPNTLSATNKAEIRRAFEGYESHAVKVIAYIIPVDDDGVEADYAAALNYFLITPVQYIALPEVSNTAAAVTWIKDKKESDEGCAIKLVLANANAANHEGVINLTSTGMTDGTTTFTPAQYCSRIAGMAATCPLNKSLTYAPLPELTGVGYLSKDELDTAIDAGKLVFFYDGEKVKIGRGVNSYYKGDDGVYTAGKSQPWGKIRVVDIMDLIRGDISRTAQDSYIGKYANSYMNKLLLVNAINDYFGELVKQGALNNGACDIDTAANKQWCKDNGVDISNLTDKEIREYPTGDDVFLTANIKILDAMEDITLNVTI